MESVEMRWFFNKTKYQKQAEEWFIKLGGNLLQSEKRIDYYLIPGKGSAEGIKYREEKIEIKQKTPLLKDFSSAMDKYGVAEKYLKWKFSIRGDDNTPSELKHDARWIAVIKKRNVVKIEIKENGKIGIATSGIADDGCTIEINEIKVLDQLWWGIAVESFAVKNTVLSNFIAAMDFISHAKKEFKPFLKRKNSMGYPEWIKTLSKNIKTEKFIV